MQISKFSLWVCAFAIGGVMALHAEDTPAQAAARAALLKQLQSPDTNPPAATPAPAGSATKTTTTTNAPAKAASVAAQPAPGMKPIVAPPLPIPMSKEQKLQELLAKYKADQITAKQYQEQRAAILAEP